MTVMLELPRVDVPDETVWNSNLGAYLHTGTNALHAVNAMPSGLDVAIDIETPSVTDSFTIKCVTAAWEQHGDTHSVLLDVSRQREDAQWFRVIAERARWLILHKSEFDIPGLVAAELLTLDQVYKVMDTLILARSAWSDTLERKGLEALAQKVLGMRELSGALKAAQRASGLTSNDKWFSQADIHIPVYRNGAMSDTVVTLRLAHPLFELAVNRQLDHPFERHGHTDRDSATELILREQQANRVMLRRAARGIEVDLEYKDSYVETVHVQRDRAEKVVSDAGCRPGVGMDIIKKLETEGHLPGDWPRTEKGNLKSDKAAMALLPDHPIATAHLTIAHTKKVLGYMDKVAARSRITGRLHPQFSILGASATGRMSASEPELQQFPKEARPILLCDKESNGLHSVDFSAIEPALLGWMSQDWQFIDPFEAGSDIYQPVQISAGLPLNDDGRKIAKVVVLAGMYGQGRAKLARNLRITQEQADELRSQMRHAMPKASQYMRALTQIGEQYGLAITVSGRILTIPRFNGEPAGYKAVNFTFQGSCADLIYEAIVNTDKAGVGDYIMLPMHDEIVCSSEAADEIQRIMATPPQRLIDWAGGRIPVIRTDSQALGRAWRAC